MCNALILSLSKFWKVIAQRLIILAISFRPQIPHHKELSQKGKYWQHPTLSEITPTQSALIGISRSGGFKKLERGSITLGLGRMSFSCQGFAKKKNQSMFYQHRCESCSGHLVWDVLKMTTTCNNVWFVCSLLFAQGVAFSQNQLIFPPRCQVCFFFWWYL